MIPQRLSVKYFVTDPEAADLPAMIPIFHRWIQEGLVEGLLIDVADYKHVHEGPGIMLIGHEADYALDMGRGRPGLIYNRKRDHGDSLRSALCTVICRALHGCYLLQTESSLGDGFAFSTGEAEITFQDRLQLPNQEASLDRVRTDLEAIFAEIYAGSDCSLTRIDADPRHPLAIRVHIPDADDLTTLLHRFSTNHTGDNRAYAR